ncbi:MAG TPA: radical SAM protein [Candidatus Eisenbacteria bacterium]|nr:radical SAM protein [Candidatus Eisenbacteria bacterium]
MSRDLLQHREIQLCIDNRELHLILLPTEACNFRCVYCYESFRFKRMEPWVVEGVKRLLSRRAADLNALSISWFGGEPLLALDVMEDVLRHVGGLRREFPSLRFTSDATTNASLLTRPVMERLVALGVRRYQVTFDGPRECHDRKRVLAGGRGTFDRIWGNLLALKASEAAFSIMVRVHVDRENFDAIESFLQEYRRAFGDDPRFEIFIRGLSRLGGSNDASLRILEGEEGTRSIENLRARAVALGLRQKQMKLENSICYAARANSFVVRANGNLNKCTVALENPRNVVGRIHADGRLAIDKAVMIPWMRGLRSGDRQELQCPMRGHAEPWKTGGLARPGAVHLPLEPTIAGAHS